MPKLNLNLDAQLDTDDLALVLVVDPKQMQQLIETLQKTVQVGVPGVGFIESAVITGYLQKWITKLIATGWVTVTPQDSKFKVVIQKGQ